MGVISNIKLSRNHSRSRTKSSKGSSFDNLKSRSLDKSLRRSGAVTAGILNNAASKEIHTAYGYAPRGADNTRNNTQHNSVVSLGNTSSNHQVKNISGSVSLDKKFKNLRSDDPASPMSRNGKKNDKSNKDLHSIQNTIERA